MKLTARLFLIVALAASPALVVQLHYAVGAAWWSLALLSGGLFLALLTAFLVGR